MPHTGGRPKYVPTDADRSTVRNMAAAGIHHETIASCLGKNGIDDKTMRKHFRRELDISQHLVTGFAMSKLYAAIQNGEAWAICFWMKCRAGFQETSAHRLVDAKGRDSTLAVEQAISIAQALRVVRLEMQAKQRSEEASQAAQAKICQESRFDVDTPEQS